MVKRTDIAVSVFDAALIRLLVVGAVGDNYTSELATARTLAAVADPRRGATACANGASVLRSTGSNTTNLQSFLSNRTNSDNFSAKKESRSAKAAI